MIEILRETSTSLDEPLHPSFKVIGSKPLSLGARNEHERTLQLCREVVLLVNSLREKATEHAR